jgi:hypothetical protein
VHPFSSNAIKATDGIYDLFLIEIKEHLMAKINLDLFPTNDPVMFNNELSSFSKPIFFLMLKID